MRQCVDERTGGETRYYLTPPSDINMRLPNSILNCVGFVAHDQPKIEYGGTCFLVGIKGTEDNVFMHVVTAKHVAEAVEHGPFVVGVNLKGQGKALLQAGDTARWWYHPTEAANVDAAVTLFSGTQEQIDTLAVEFIPESMFATDNVIKQNDIGIGDELSIVGLFTRFSGVERHHPIVRMGNIAMMPTERIPAKGFGNIEAYLVEGRSIGGLSGSPVFVRDTLNMPVGDGKGGIRKFLGLGQLYFLGLMHGHWDLPVGFKTTEQAEAVNMGISIVVPAKKILEILYHPELVQMRKQRDEEIRNEKLPVQDSGLSKQKPFTKDDFETALQKASRKVPKS